MLERRVNRVYEKYVRDVNMQIQNSNDDFIFLDVMKNKRRKKKNGI